MSLWRAITSLGRSRSLPEAERGCPKRSPNADPAFAAAVTALGAKLARADGRAEPVEFDSFVEAFQPEESAARDIDRLYRLARGTTLGYEGYAKALARRYDNCPQLLETVLDGLFHVAKADGMVNSDELVFLERVAELFGLSPLTFRRVKADHLGLPANDPYRLLEVAPDAPDAAVHEAWKRQLLVHHPDRAVSRGLSRDLVEAAQAKASAINAAFDAVMRERRSLVPGAA
jgi:DnaJ like chaperone protein